MSAAFFYNLFATRTKVRDRIDGGTPVTQERKVTDMEELTQKVNDFIIALCRLNIPRGGSGRMD